MGNYWLRMLLSCKVGYLPRTPKVSFVADSVRRLDVTTSGVAVWRFT
jgi:hypothetical protein